MRKLVFFVCSLLCLIGFYYCLSNDPGELSIPSNDYIQFKMIDGGLLSTNDYNESDPLLVYDEQNLYLYYLSDNPNLGGYGGKDLYRVQYLPQEKLFANTIENANNIFTDMNDEQCITSYFVTYNNGWHVVYTKDDSNHVFYSNGSRITDITPQTGDGNISVLEIIDIQQDIIVMTGMINHSPKLFKISISDQQILGVVDIPVMFELLPNTTLLEFRIVKNPTPDGTMGLFVHLLQNNIDKYYWISPEWKIFDIRLSGLMENVGGMNIGDDGRLYFHGKGPAGNLDLWRYTKQFNLRDGYFDGDNNLIPTIEPTLPTLSTPTPPTPPTPTPTPIPSTPLQISVDMGSSFLDTSIAADANFVYISYFDDTNMDLKFARSDDYGEHWETVSIVDTLGEVNGDCSIAVSNNIVFISYFDPMNGDLKFARSDANGDPGTWNVITTVDDGGVNEVGSYSSIGVSGTSVYISYFDASANALKFARSDANGDPGTWLTIVEIDNGSGMGAGSHTDIHVEAPYVYISYFDTYSSLLKFARSDANGDSGTWVYMSADNSFLVGKYSSIDVMGTNVYISYYDESNTDLKFAISYNNGDTWDPIDMVTVDGTGFNTGEYTSLKVVDTTVYVSYYNSSDTNLMMALSSNNGEAGTWTPQAVDNSSFDVGSYSSLAVSENFVYISFVDTMNGELWLARSSDYGITWK